MEQLFLHEVTRQQIDGMRTAWPQSLLISGMNGGGVTHVARTLAREIDPFAIELLPRKDSKVDIKKGVISIDAVRELTSQLTTKSVEKKVIVVYYAETMTPQAQNALLKFLEEPRTHVHIILACHDTSRLLSTITSRVTELRVRPLSWAQSAEFIRQYDATTPTKVQQLLFIATGKPGLLHDLMHDNDLFDQYVTRIKTVQELLRVSLYERIVMMHKYSTDRTQAAELLDSMIALLTYDISTKKTASNDTMTRLTRVLKGRKALDQNANVRLTLLTVVL